MTRPGISLIASGLAVELMVSVLQHPQKSVFSTTRQKYIELKLISSSRGNAAAEISSDAMTTVQQHQEPDKGDSPLGVVPHSIRGFLHRHQQVLPATEAFYNCTACSPLILQRYAESGYAFLLEVFNNPDCLEQVSGLADLHKDMATVEVFNFFPFFFSQIEIHIFPARTGITLTRKNRQNELKLYTHCIPQD